MIRKLFLTALIATGLVCCKEANKENTDGHGSKYNEPLILKGMTHGLIKPPVNIIKNESDSLSYQIYLAEKSVVGESMIKGNKMEVRFGPETPLLINDSEVEFKLLHFHTPAYHLIQGEEFPLEFHVITIPKEKSGSDPEYLVVSILFRIGQTNQFIEELLQKPAGSGMAIKESQLNILLGGRAMVNKTNDNLDGFYHYIGPLATPPKTNSVNWYIARRIFEISEEQLNTIIRLKSQEKP